ncbi:NUDIX hydrolase [Candidatus Methylomirabilis sp.]|uniref:NUDIX hydrolase n=1 Tax=Candidatus Methylomirabilis tolerans TaxID=3123416 RepID=A0AAJ1EK62_9BACT|nr:NUDIX hydrolase [Candidatus Methylomirabilis sp.]
MKLIEQVLGTQVVYAGAYLSTEQQTVVLPDGRQAVRDIVRPPNAVAIVPIDDDGRIYLVRQYRPAIRRAIYEIPAGIIDHGERPTATARRECEEEIGLRPRRLLKLCTFYSAVGFSTGSIQLFLAQGLIAGRDLRHDPTEFLQIHTIPFEQAYQWVLSHKIVDAKSIVGILWTKQRFDLPLRRDRQRPAGRQR